MWLSPLEELCDKVGPRLVVLPWFLLFSLHLIAMLYQGRRVRLFQVCGTGVILIAALFQPPGTPALLIGGACLYGAGIYLGSWSASARAPEKGCGSLTRPAAVYFAIMLLLVAKRFYNVHETERQKEHVRTTTEQVVQALAKQDIPSLSRLCWNDAVDESRLGMYLDSWFRTVSIRPPIEVKQLTFVQQDIVCASFSASVTTCNDEVPWFIVARSAAGRKLQGETVNCNLLLKKRNGVWKVPF